MLKKPHNSSKRTFHLKSWGRNQTKTRDNAKLILKGFSFSVGKLMERNNNTVSSAVWICRTWCTRMPTHMCLNCAYTHHQSTRSDPLWTLSADSLQAWEGFQVWLTWNRFWWSGSLWALCFYCFYYNSLSGSYLGNLNHWHIWQMFNLSHSVFHSSPLPFNKQVTGQQVHKALLRQ